MAFNHKVGGSIPSAPTNKKEKDMKGLGIGVIPPIRPDGFDFRVGFSVYDEFYDCDCCDTSTVAHVIEINLLLLSLAIKFYTFYKEEIN